MQNKIESLSSAIADIKVARCATNKFVEITKVIEISQFIEVRTCMPGMAFPSAPPIAPATRRQEIISEWTSVAQRGILVKRRRQKKSGFLNVHSQATIAEVTAKRNWEQLETPLVCGDVIRVHRKFLSADEFRIYLEPGLVCTVESIDNDGDAQVRFP